MRYSILDPTGNITALVDTPVPVGEQPSVAAHVMARHPEVEQVGFVSFGDAAGPEAATTGVADAAASEKKQLFVAAEGMPAKDAPALPALRMAGGEFCGNASLSAAALLAMRGGYELPARLSLAVSGTDAPVEVDLAAGSDGSYAGAVRMPQPLEVGEVELCFEGVRGSVPLVRLEGISHLVVEEGSAFFGLVRDARRAELAVRSWCVELGCDGLGLMFLEKADGVWHLSPLVFVPGGASGGTVFWERSCASGSAAVGMWFSACAGGAGELELVEPGGVLRVVSDGARGATWLHGHVRMVGEYLL